MPPPVDGGAGADDAAWPAEVDLILSAMDSGRHRSADVAAGIERRAWARLPFRVKGRLRLFSDAPHVAPRAIYTRDAHARGLGFITPHRLPLGYGGFVEFTGPDGRPRRIQCTLHRCRETAPGWFEGSVHFNREQLELIEHAS
jgi:hypothetical protein